MVSSTRTAPLKGLLSHDNVIVAGALAAAAVLAWLWLLRAPMAAMGVAPLSAGYLAPAFAMWAIMMVAMMVPSAAPMILLHARIDKASTRSQRTRNNLLFTFSYLLVWCVFSAIAALAQALLVSTGYVSEMALSFSDRQIAAALLLAAAAYELTAAKRLCLDKCHSPMLFILKHWKPGAAGAVRLGLAHGLFCVGCCWALMLLLFVGGVMNLAWVALLGMVVLGEKFAPATWHAERYCAAALTGGAAFILYAEYS
jgi:predicted metal-binding membrane protein